MIIAKLTKVLFSSMLFSMLLTLVACATPYRSLDQPTQEFYINDAADALLQSTKWYIYVNGETYYESTLNDSTITNDLEGVQIVVATHIGEVGSINTTKIFNDFGVGKNNLGIMIFLFYDEVDGNLVFKELVFEIGIKMMEYLSAFEASSIIDDYFYNDPIIEDVDEAIINLYFELIYVTSNKLYGWSYSYVSYNYYHIYDYFEEKYSFTKPLPSEDSIWGFQLDLWQVILIMIGLVVILGVGGRFFFPIVFSMLGFGSNNRGGGGQSRGYWFRK
ncbi:hypothetical protein JV173_02880 [Acholeplasma equirhinis]|uniref:hypothetical protein n=1 Tax=Acholeplasma equirhinis TaxID=555393 RepID=UPI00197B01C7|nr:hypothetical protein [Acholeplasma equirhinis]MBN3490453.1 hypothetical protein [Acholeplasma equirhinis]